LEGTIVFRRFGPIAELVTVNAIDNDDGKPGEFLAELCREAGDRLRLQYTMINQVVPPCTGACLSRGCNFGRRV
jgi:hypothetical protein